MPKTRWQRFKEKLRKTDMVEKLIVSWGILSVASSLSVASYLGYHTYRVFKYEKQKEAVVSLVLESSPEIIQRLSQSFVEWKPNSVRTEVSASARDSPPLFEWRVGKSLSFLERIPCSISGFYNWKQYVVASAGLVRQSTSCKKDTIAFVNRDNPESIFMCDGKAENVFDFAMALIHEATHLAGYKHDQSFGQYNYGQSLEFTAFAIEKRFLDDVLAFSITRAGNVFLREVLDLNLLFANANLRIESNILRVYEKEYPGTEN